MESAFDWLLGALSLPRVGLPAVFLVSLISATLLPLGSEPAVFAYAKLHPDMFWPLVLVATAGNTIGGMIDWWIGHAAKVAMVRLRTQGERRAAQRRFRHRHTARFTGWFRRVGPPVLLLSWLPGLGDPLCVLAGWLRLHWRPCLVYMAIGKFLRYAVLTALLLWMPDAFWQNAWDALSSLWR
ncbi:MAG: DedA family protein [Candidatus Protistobacter heckmanni]|nr:DedA family protein [Candidatus Protistobacter heckmanni]